MWRLVPALAREMGAAYPELVRAETLITETLQLEERSFRRTLERGLAILEAESRKLGEGQVFSGEVAFTLYDTYGFPLDLTQDALRPRNITVDTGAFGAAMQRQRQKARAAWSGSGDAATETVWFQLREKAGATEFLGYDTEAAEGVVLGLVRDGKAVDAIAAGESGFADSQPDAVLRRIGRAGRRHRHDFGGGRRSCASRTRKRSSATSSPTP